MHTQNTHTQTHTCTDTHTCTYQHKQQFQLYSQYSSIHILLITGDYDQQEYVYHLVFGYKENNKLLEPTNNFDQNTYLQMLAIQQHLYGQQNNDFGCQTSVVVGAKS